VFSLFWYQIYTNFDSQYIFDYTYIIFFNLAFTSLPVIVMGVLDQDVDDRVSLAVPQLYRRGIERKEWTQPKFWYVTINFPIKSSLTSLGPTCLTVSTNL
jgi:phospholipid-translocating ATPase